MVLDPEAYRGKKVVLAGGGDSALDWTIFLANIAKEVTLVHRSESFRGMSRGASLLRLLVVLGFSASLGRPASAKSAVTLGYATGDVWAATTAGLLMRALRIAIVVGYFAGTANLKFELFVSLAATVTVAVCVPSRSCHAVIV